MIVVTWGEIGLFLLVFAAAWAVLGALIWVDERADRRGERKPCTSYEPCPECHAEPPSRLDRADRPRTRDEVDPLWP